MSKTESSNITLTWNSSANNGGDAELDRLTPVYNNDEQSASYIHDRVKYVHVDCGFHNNRKLGLVLIEEGKSLHDTVMKRIISGDVQYAP